MIQYLQTAENRRKQGRKMKQAVHHAALSVLPLLLVLIWGNSVALCKIVPIVGGAIGGLIGGIFACANLVVIKGFSRLWLKILVSVGMLGGTFGVCYGIALAILSAV